MKSYGRAPTFLMLTGYEQVRSVVAALTGDLETARRVELTLPATGVCSAAPVTGDTESACCATTASEATVTSCCAPAPAESASACCAPAPTLVTGLGRRPSSP